VTGDLQVGDKVLVRAASKTATTPKVTSAGTAFYNREGMEMAVIELKDIMKIIRWGTP
jgi:hypothetical protein